MTVRPLSWPLKDPLEDRFNTELAEGSRNLLAGFWAFCCLWFRRGSDDRVMWALSSLRCWCSKLAGGYTLCPP